MSDVLSVAGGGFRLRVAPTLPEPVSCVHARGSIEGSIDLCSNLPSDHIGSSIADTMTFLDTLGGDPGSERRSDGGLGLDVELVAMAEGPVRPTFERGDDWTLSFGLLQLAGSTVATPRPDGRLGDSDTAHDRAVLRERSPTCALEAGAVKG